MLTTVRCASVVSVAMRSSTWPESSRKRSSNVSGPSRHVRGWSSSMTPSRRRSRARVVGSAATLTLAAPSSEASSSMSPVATMSRIASMRCRRSNLAMREICRISSASRRHGPAVIIRASATSSCGSAIARRLCSRSRISGVANSDRPPSDRVRDVLVTQTGDDGLAVLVLAIQDRDVRPARVRRHPAGRGSRPRWSPPRPPARRRR